MKARLIHPLAAPNQQASFVLLVLTAFPLLAATAGFLNIIEGNLNHWCVGNGVTHRRPFHESLVLQTASPDNLCNYRRVILCADRVDCH